MRPIRAFKGKVTSDPSLMTMKQLEKYKIWVEEYLEWCLLEDGRVGSYDRMSDRASPYFDEIEKRKSQGDTVVKKKAKKILKRKTAAAGSKLKIVNLKITARDRKSLSALAEKHAKGNLSAWLRHSGLKYVPKRGEQIQLSPIPVKGKSNT